MGWINVEGKRQYVREDGVSRSDRPETYRDIGGVSISSNQVDRTKGCNNNMSLCFALEYGNIAYIAADSRSSYTKINNLGFLVGYEIETDDYKKIINVNINGETAVLISTGQNKFGIEHENFADIVKKITAQPCENIKDFIKEVRNVFSKLKYPRDVLDITILFTDKGKLYTYYFPDNIEDSSFRTPDSEELCACWQGVRWAKSVFEYSEFDRRFISEEHTLSQINEVYNKVYRVSKTFDNSVGGPVRIGKLTPEGFTWIQNGYEL